MPYQAASNEVSFLEKIVTVSHSQTSDFSSNGTIFPAMEVGLGVLEFLLSSTLPI